MVNLYPEAGGRPEIDLSDIQFEESYYFPKAGTIDASYQKGFPIDPDLEKRWRGGEGHAIAAEFVTHYYRSRGYGSALEVWRTSDNPKGIGLVTVHLRTKGEDGRACAYTRCDVWVSRGRIMVEA